MKINFYNYDLASGQRTTLYGQGVGLIESDCFENLAFRKGFKSIRAMGSCCFIPILAQELCFFCGTPIDPGEAQNSHEQAQAIISKSALKRAVTTALICSSCNCSPESSFILRPLFFEKKG